MCTFIFLEGMQFSLAIREYSMVVSQNTRLPHNPAVPILGKYAKEIKVVCSRDSYIQMFIAALFGIAKI